MSLRPLARRWQACCFASTRAGAARTNTSCRRQPRGTRVRNFGVPRILAEACPRVRRDVHIDPRQPRLIEHAIHIEEVARRGESHRRYHGQEVRRLLHCREPLNGARVRQPVRSHLADVVPVVPKLGTLSSTRALRRGVGPPSFLTLNRLPNKAHRVADACREHPALCAFPLLIPAKVYRCRIRSDQFQYTLV